MALCTEKSWELLFWEAATAMDKRHTEMLLSFGASRLDTIPGQRLNNAEQRKLKAEYANLPSYQISAKGSMVLRKARGTVAKLRWDWGLTDMHYLNRVLRGDLHLKSGDHGKKRIYEYKWDANEEDTDAFEAAMCTQTKETGLCVLLARYNLRTGQNKSLAEFWRKAKRMKMKRKKRKTVSTLMARHEIGRMLFATEHLSCTMDI
jgi:hypothetical protein